jgi:transposase
MHMETAASVRLSEGELASLQAVLAEDPAPRVAARVTGVLLLASGMTPAAAAERVGIAPSTLRRWATRYLESRSPGVFHPEARSRHRSARDPRTMEAIHQALTVSPRSLGYVADAWTPALLRSHLASAERIYVSQPVLQRILDRLPG